MEKQVKDIKADLKVMESSCDEEKKGRETLETEVDELRRAKQEVVDENEALKGKVQKGIEDIAGALGDGYGRCLARLAADGVDVAGHSLEDYIRDYAS